MRKRLGNGAGLVFRHPHFIEMSGLHPAYRTVGSDGDQVTRNDG